MKLLGDRLRRSRRQQHAPPVHGDESRHAGFHTGGDVGCKRTALGTGHGECAKLAGANVLHYRQCIGEHNLHIAGEQVLHRQDAAFVRDVHDVDVCKILQHFAGKLGDAAGAAGAEVELTGIGARIGNELTQRLGRRFFRIDDENVGSRCDQRHRDEVAFDVVRHFREKRIHRRRAEICDDEAVAVGWLMRRVFHADRPRRAGLVLDDHRLTPELAQLLCDDPRHQVGAAGRRIRDNELDGLRRIRLRECSAGKKRCGQHHEKRSCRSHHSSSSVARALVGNLTRSSRPR